MAIYPRAVAQVALTITDLDQAVQHTRGCLAQARLTEVRPREPCIETNSNYLSRISGSRPPRHTECMAPQSNQSRVLPGLYLRRR